MLPEHHQLYGETGCCPVSISLFSSVSLFSSISPGKPGNKSFHHLLVFNVIVWICKCKNVYAMQLCGISLRKRVLVFDHPFVF